MKNVIIYIGRFELPDKNAAAHRVLSNAKIFRKLGYSTVFIDATKTENLNGVFKSKVSAGFECWTMDCSSVLKDWVRTIRIDEFKEVFSKHRDNVYAVIAYNYPAVAMNRIRCLCKKNNIKCFSDITEWVGFSGGGVIRRLLKGIDDWYGMQIVNFKMDGIIAISRYLYKYYKDRVKTVYIPPLVDKSEPKWMKENTECQNRSLIITYAGRPGHAKDNLNILIDAVLRTEQNVVLNIVGITKNQFLQQYKKQSKITNYRDDIIRFYGRLKHIDAIKIIQKSDFTIFYRDNSRVTMAGFPTKFTESISCGVPVITTDTSDLKSFMTDGVNGFFLNSDLTESLKNIFSKDISQLRNMKKNVNSDMFDYNAYISEMKLLLPTISI